MNIPPIDRSKYLKGLLITAKLDKELSQNEKDIIKTISDKLGFASDFYKETIASLLSNKYIFEETIIFSDERIARSFLVDAVKLACSNNLVTENEINWIKKVAESNNIEKSLVDKQLKNYLNSPNSAKLSEFALYSII